MAPAVPPMNVAANPFGMPSGLATPPTTAVVGNPFGAPMGAPMGAPIMGGAPMGGFGMPNQPPMPAGGGFISPTPNIFSAQIPNPQAAVNPNPSSSQLPW